MLKKENGIGYRSIHRTLGLEERLGRLHTSYFGTLDLWVEHFGKGLWAFFLLSLVLFHSFTPDSSVPSQIQHDGSRALFVRQ